LKKTAIRFGQEGGGGGFMLHNAKDLTIDSTGGSGSNNRPFITTKWEKGSTIWSSRNRRSILVISSRRGHALQNSWKLLL